MLKFLFFALLCCGVNCSFASPSDSLKSAKTTPIPVSVQKQKINDSITIQYVEFAQLYSEGWSQLKRPLFWKTMMQLPSDSCAINIGSTREIIQLMSMKEWDNMSRTAKDQYRDSIREARNLGDDEHIYRTRGKQKFYNFDGILQDISRGVNEFEEQGVDPWYAQSILMVESPGKLHLSPAGAYGAFQLMPKVARKFGLTVNRYHDDRKDFKKSAIAASKLLSTICIPEAKKMLDAHHITYCETDLWFRLFVMHVYNAGAYNVAGVMDKINPKEGGMALIQKMWVTDARKFRNASQNYSQVTLAALMLLKQQIKQVTAIASL